MGSGITENDDSMGMKERKQNKKHNTHPDIIILGLQSKINSLIIILVINFKVISNIHSSVQIQKAPVHFLASKDHQAQDQVLIPCKTCRWPCLAMLKSLDIN